MCKEDIWVYLTSAIWAFCASAPCVKPQYQANGSRRHQLSFENTLQPLVRMKIVGVCELDSSGLR